MPSKSMAQHRLMEMIAHGGKPRGKKGPSAQVARDFVAADKGKNLKSLPNKVRETKEADAGGGQVLSEADYRPKKAKRGKVRVR